MRFKILYYIASIIVLLSCSLGRTLPEKVKINIISNEDDFFGKVNNQIWQYFNYNNIVIDTVGNTDYYLILDTLITSFSKSPITELCEDDEYDCEYTYKTIHYKVEAKLLDSNNVFLTNITVTGSNDEKYSVKNIENRYKISLFSPFRVKYKGIDDVSADEIARTTTRLVSNYIYETKFIPLKELQKADKKRLRKERKQK